MSLAPGVRIGSYEVMAVIGRGGMGEVYRAHDTQLGRDVALKILPDVFAHDPDRLARFQREASLLASLNHPNIAIVHGLEETGGTRAIVMELVDGPTLADRIQHGPLPVDEALAIARQMADALEAAHERGVIHRDLKPANVKVREDGTVKVLDFGLAKAWDPAAAGGADFSHSPTLTSPAMTQQGIILGTAAYMAPEQARGKPIDRRVDIWAFGVVLYEMLTGQRLFAGEDVSMTLSMVLQRQPDWTALPSGLPPTTRAFLERCLEKDPRRRVRHIGDVRLALDGAFDVPAPAGAAIVPPRSSWRTALAVGAGVVIVSAVTGLAVWDRRGTPAPASRPVSRFTITLSPNHVFVRNIADPIAITPDGRRILFNARSNAAGETEQRLLVRSLDALEAVPVPGGDDIGSAFLSPDGEWVGFNSGLGTDNALRKMRLTGGPTATIASVPMSGYAGATWGTDGTIVFTLESGRDGLRMVPDGGGTPTLLIAPSEDDRYLHPHLLPDARRVLFTHRRVGEPDRIEILDRDTRQRSVLTEGTWPRYLASGHLLFAREGSVWAGAFDLEMLELRGEPQPVLEDVSISALGLARLAVSDDGTVVYLPGRSAVGSVLTWVNRVGAVSALPLGAADYWLPRLSPDGRSVAVGIAADLWVIDLERGGRIRLTFGETSARFPFTWTSDGRFIAFAGPESNRIYRVPADGSARAEVLLEGEHPQWPTSSSGGTLAFYVNAPGTLRDLWTLPAGSGAEPQRFLSTAFQERSGRFSPDGRWLAYVSNESGRDEVYVRPFPGPGGHVPISISGGTEPVWSRSGQELFYRLGSAVMVVGVQGTPAFTAGPPRQLFANESLVVETGGVGGNQAYDVHPDSQRFLMLFEPPFPTEARVILNWFEELKRLVPVD